MKTFWAVFFAILAAAAVLAVVLSVVIQIRRQTLSAENRLIAKEALARRIVDWNEESAVASLRTINTSEITYHSSFPSFPSYSRDLASLGPGVVVPNPNHAGLIDEVLASGKKSDYVFRYNAGAADRRGRIEAYTVTASPVVFGKTGLKNFFMDETGVIRETFEDREATRTDPPLAR